MASQCLSARAKRRTLAFRVGNTPRKLCERMREKIDTPDARKRYARRAGIVEPVFANIRYCKGMDRFTYRGKKKVNTQWQLFCLVHNLEKLAKYGKKYATTPPSPSSVHPLYLTCALSGLLNRLLGHLLLSKRSLTA
ncbi:MAG: transposase [Verrucomicrobiota bacterium]